jgi:hypothetical protein
MTTTTTTTYPACALPDCDVVAKSGGLCNAHYMARYRAQQRQIEKELLDVVASQRAGATAFLCDVCEEDASVWWASNGNTETPVVLCASCVEAKIESLRLDIRRLELKQP